MNMENYNMGEDEIINCLIDPKYHRRGLALNFIEERISSNKYRFPFFSNPRNVFKSLTVVLIESHAESVKIKCLDLMIKLMPALKEDLDDCFLLAVPIIFKHFINSKNSIKKRAIEVWSCFVKLSRNGQSVVNYLVELGLNSKDHSLGEFFADNISLLIVDNNNTEVNYRNLINSLLKHFGFGNGHGKERIIQCFNKIEQIIGHEKYTRLISKSPYYMNILFSKLLKNEEMNRADCLLKLGPLSSVFINLYNGEKGSIHEKASNELNEILLDNTCFENLKPNIGLVLKLIANLLREENHLKDKVCLGLLDAVKIIVEKLCYENMDHFETTLSIMVQKIGNANEEVRDIFKIIDHFVPSELFLENLFPFIKSHSWHIRKNSLDLTTLVFLDDRLKLSIGLDPLFGRKAELIQLVIACMISRKPLLKLSAFECLAAMADHFKFPSNQSTEGSYKPFLVALATHLDTMGVLTTDEKNALFIAMKARILRNVLPIEEKNGQLTYALSTSKDKGADVDWINDGLYGDRVVYVQELNMSGENYKSFINSGDRIKVSDQHDIPINLIQSSPTPRRGFTYLPPVENLTISCGLKQHRQQPQESQIPRPVTTLSGYSYSCQSSIRFPKKLHNTFLQAHKIEGLVDKKGKGPVGDKQENKVTLNVSKVLEEIKTSSLKTRARNVSKNSIPSRRQASCGATCDISKVDISHLNNVSRSSSYFYGSHCSEYDLTELKKLSEDIGFNFNKPSVEPESIVKCESNNQNINNYRPTRQIDLSDGDNEITTIASPRFPWRSKRRIQPKKKFFMKEFQTVADDESNQKPITNPVASYNEALLGLSLDIWNEKYLALEMIKRLCLYHPNVIKSDLVSLTRCVLKEVRNLRSKVSLLAISTLGELFCQFNKLMDKGVDESVRTLLIKCGETNKFIREEAEKSLTSIVDNVTVARSLGAIIPFGTSYKSVMVQQTSSRLLKKILNSIGANKILRRRELASKFLPASVGFLLASSQVVRDQGNIIMRNMMMSGKDFRKVLHKFVPENVITNAQDRLDFIKSTMTYDTSKSSLNDRSSIRIEDNIFSCSSNTLKIIHSAPEIEGIGDKLSKPSSKNANLVSQLIAGIESDFNSAESDDHLRGLNCLEQILQERPAYDHGIVQILQSFITCLTDKKEEVVLKALRVLIRLLVLLYDQVDNVDYLVDQVSANLNSSDEEIVEAALKCLDCIMEHFEPFTLLPMFIRNGMKCKKVFKTDFITRVHYLYNESLVQRPIQSTSITYQFLWHILGLLNQRQKSSTNFNSGSASRVDPIPSFESKDSSVGLPKGDSYSDMYMASQSLLLTIYSNCQDNLILRCKKSHNKQLIHEMLSTVIPDPRIS